MKLLPIIYHMRKTLPVWFSRVDATASLDIALDRSRIELPGTTVTLPAFYLMLGGDNVTNVTLGTETIVDFEEILSVVAILKNIDETGKYAQDQVHDVREALNFCLFNALFDSDSYSLIYNGGRMIGIDKARYCYQFDYKQISRFDASDGVTKDLDYFDALYATWSMAHGSDETKPHAEDHIENIYPLN